MKRYAIVDESHATVRSGPGVEHATLGWLQRDERAELMEECGKWLRIKYRQREGYVPACRCGVVDIDE